MKRKIMIPLILLIVCLGTFIISSILLQNKPFISSIEPSIGNPGDILVITGKNFGNERQHNEEVNLAGVWPVPKSYRVWSDTRIEIYLPDKLKSGMVSIIKDSGRSNGILFTNEKHIPIELNGPSQGLPFIEEIDPPTGNTGTKIVITGANFGFEKGNSNVYFTRENIVNNNTLNITDIMIPASDKDFDYVEWTDKKITLYVPDGAVSGSVVVKPDKGEKESSNGFFFELKGQAGIRIFTVSKTYRFSYGVALTNVNASLPNSLDIWIPHPVNSIFQHTININYSQEPVWQIMKVNSNVLRFRFDDLKSWRNYNIELNASVLLFGFETRIQKSRIPKKYNVKRDLYKYYTDEDLYIPSENKAFKDLGAKLKKSDSNPYLRARKIYDLVLKKMTYDKNAPIDSVSSQYKSGKGDAYIYNAVFCGISRSAGIPARMVSGFYAIPQKKMSRHIWSEVYFEKVGWIPVDPVLGDEIVFNNAIEIIDPKDFYFGNMDLFHIMMSRGFTDISKINVQSGTCFFDKNAFPLLKVHSESSGSLEKFNLIWNDFLVTSVW